MLLTTLTRKLFWLCSNYSMPTLQVADSRGHTLFQKDDAASGKFAFTTEDYDMFEVCFHSTAVGM